MSQHRLEWISKHPKEVAKYEGKWVAITKDGIVASGDSIKEIDKELSGKNIKEQPLIMKIPRKDEELLLPTIF